MQEYTEQELRVNLWQERKYCSRIGLMLFCTIVITLISQIWIGVLYATGLNHLISYSTVLAIMLMGHYVIVIPVCYAITVEIPRAPLGNEEVTAGRFVKWFTSGCSVFFVGGIVGMRVHELVYSLLGKSSSDPVGATVDSMGPWVAFLCVCIIGPVMEELVFRRFMLGSLARYGEKLALLTSALLFGLFHGNFSQFFYAFGLGLILGYAYLKTGKLRWPILLHMVFNVYGSFGSLFLAEYKTLIALWGYFMIACAICGIVVLIRNVKHVTLSKDGLQISAGACWGSFGMVLALLGCIFLFIMNYAV